MYCFLYEEGMIRASWSRYYNLCRFLLFFCSTDVSKKIKATGYLRITLSAIVADKILSIVRFRTDEGRKPHSSHCNLLIEK